jgi:anthranilate synthase component 1
MVEAFADLETPLSLYLKLAHSKDGGRHSFLLESVVGGERFGRYSFIGLPAHTLLRVSGFGKAARHRGRAGTAPSWRPCAMPKPAPARRRWTSSPQYQQRFKVALRPGLPRFCGGLAGYFGYDTVRHIEKKLVHRPARPTRWVAPTSCSCSAKSWR